MALRRFGELILRVAGIFLLLNIINFALTTYQQGLGVRDFLPGWILGLVLLSFLVVVLLFLLFPQFLASYLVSDEISQDNQDEMSADLLALLERVAASLAGLFFFITGIGDGLYYFVEWSVSRPVGAGYWHLNRIGHISIALFEMIAGIWLIFGARGLMNLVLWLREIRPGSAPSERD